MTRRTLLLSLAALPTCRWGSKPGPAEKAAAWLLAHQSPDGAFRSEVYGLFKHGHSLTPLALGALIEAPGGPRDAIDRGLDFLVSARSADGALGLLAIHDYPMYATALATSALVAAGRRADAEPMVAWMLSQQLRGEGWGDHPSRGGFPMGSLTRREPPHAGHVDLSMTRRVLQALVAHGLPRDHEAWSEARRFVLRCRTSDGGFRYSPGEPALNKGRDSEAGYGSAACDGTLALHALGEDTTAATAWLAERFEADANPGIGDGPLAAYAQAMRFYWRASVSEVFAAGGGPTGWRDAIRTSLVAEQADDGSWRNELAQQKEDDPLVATCLGLAGLLRVRS